MAMTPETRQQRQTNRLRQILISPESRLRNRCCKRCNNGSSNFSNSSKRDSRSRPVQGCLHTRRSNSNNRSTKNRGRAAYAVRSFSSSSMLRSASAIGKDAAWTSVYLTIAEKR